jgi:hypothetical protein|tara:strand:- start:355 stop:615 length:261 start_codon:yes stop_codon:yes gene_type:complete
MNETNDLNDMDDELVDAMAQHLALRIGEMVADSLREAADELLKVEEELAGSNEYILVRSECIKDAKNLRVMAARINKKIKEGILWT